MEEDMEGSLSAFAEGEWDSAHINFLNDDVGFMMHQLFNDKVGEDSSSSSVAPAMWFSLDNHTNLAEANQSFFDPIGSFYRNSYHTSSHYGFNVQKEVGVVPSLSHEKYYIAESDYLPPVNNIDVSSEFCMMDVDASPVPYFWNAMVEEGNFIDGLEPGQVQPDILSSVPNLQLNLKRKVDITTFQPGQQDITSEIPKKKPRATKNACGRKGKAPSKKTSLNLSDDEAINTSSCRQMSSSYSSEDDSNASQELNAGTSSDPKLFASHDKNVKKSGRRGSAIDPQSLYARKRRERINERLRILQNLVPNGTKVDISTMLEEAVNYVKFLQTQIKLLSSDDMWMYAPIAYNGVDIGLDRNLSRNL